MVRHTRNHNVITINRRTVDSTVVMPRRAGQEARQRTLTRTAGAAQQHSDTAAALPDPGGATRAALRERHLSMEVDRGYRVGVRVVVR